MHCNGLKLSGVVEEFSITSRFLDSKMQKNQLFEEDKRFECIFFYQIQVQVSRLGMSVTTQCGSGRQFVTAL